MDTKRRCLTAVLRCLLLAVAITTWWPVAATAQEAGTSPVANAGSPTTGFAAATDLNVPEEELKLHLVPMTREELSRVADVWQAHYRTELERAIALQLELLNAKGDRAAALTKQLSERAEVQRDIRFRAEAVLDAWEHKGADPEDLAARQEYLNALTKDVVDRSDLRTILRHGVDWMLSRDGGLGILIKAIGFFLLLLLVLRVARGARRVASRKLETMPGISSFLRSFLESGILWSSTLLGCVIALALVGVNMTPFLAIIGGLGFIVGFALQETLADLVTGLMIISMRPFDRGDFITAAGTSGTVERLSLLATTLRKVDNHIVIIPNSAIWADVITNRTAAKLLRVDLVFQIGYSDNASAAVDLLADLVAQHSLCLKEPSPAVFLGELGESSVHIYCRPWVHSDDYWTVYWDLTRLAKEQFDAAGITIPFPQRDVHVHGTTQLPG